MTGNELERAIQFLLESQAKNEAQIAQLTGDSADFKALVREFVEGTRRFAERADERLDRLEQDVKRGERQRQRLDQAMAELAEGMKSLLHVVEGHVTDEARHRRPPG